MLTSFIVSGSITFVVLIWLHTDFIVEYSRLLGIYDFDNFLHDRNQWENSANYGEYTFSFWLFKISENQNKIIIFFSRMQFCPWCLITFLTFIINPVFGIWYYTPFVACMGFLLYFGILLLKKCTESV